MVQLQLRNHEDVDFSGLCAVFEMERHGFLDIPEHFIHGAALCEHILANSPGAPGFTVVVNLDFDQHRLTSVEIVPLP